ncbi:MAG TPA: hypothetical protein VHC22_20140 [Pirellulales bacterium]|nr:hypothetical protein [Pirellulales bacterium]
MPSISSCPVCHRDLTIPDLTDRRQPLRCPLCDARFPADDALADSVSFPPAAIIVEAGELPSDSAEHPGERALPPSPTDEPVVPVGYVPSWSSGRPAPGDSPTIDKPADSAQRESSFRDQANEDSSSPTDAYEHDEIVEDVDESDDRSDRADDGPDNETEAFGRQVAGMRVAHQTRKQSSPFGALGQLVGMALGGIAGLAIGYYVLMWVGGPRADFLELRGKLPRWLVPGRRHNTVTDAVPFAKLSDTLDSAAADVAKKRDDFPPPPTMPDSPGNPLADTEQAAHQDFGQTPAEAQWPSAELAQVGPKPLPDAYRGPRGFKLRSAAELAEALDQVEHGLRCPRCQSPGAVHLASFNAAGDGTDDRFEKGGTARPCAYCRGKPVLNLTASTFEQLCGLGEAVTFVQLAADDPGRERLRDGAETILLAIASQRDKSEIVGRLAGTRLDDGGRLTNGIIVAGAVQQARQEGELFAVQLLLFGSGKPVTIISRQPPEPPVARRDHLAVFGSIVDSPAENLVGYVGDLPQVVWGGLHLKLASAAQ